MASALDLLYALPQLVILSLLQFAVYKVKGNSNSDWTDAVPYWISWLLASASTLALALTPLVSIPFLGGLVDLLAGLVFMIPSWFSD